MLNYRPDIDGLRAIAVGSVLLYHLQESLMPGGFVGVDIFFVISGYLITKLIYKELSETGEFAYKHFYVRRVRRLFPALFFTLLFCILLAYFLLSPAHLIEFGQSLIAAIFSVSNFFFWSISGYFDSDSSIKPLLHTWSLSVEEQFYLIWPAVLVALFSLKNHRAIPVFIVVVGGVSLLINVLFFSQQLAISSWFSTAEVQSVLDIPSTVFYWLPFRVFEFSIGAILVWIGTANSKRIAGLTFITGLAMVFASLLMLNSKMAFPSTTALLPCIGAALMIFSGQNHPFSWLVSNKLMVFVGLISYSLYLIHWPLIVFYKYSVGREFMTWELVALIAASLLFAYLMYRFIEQPFRKPKVDGSSSNRRFLVGSALGVLGAIAISANAIASQGWLWRYPSDVVAQLSYKKGDYTEFFWANIQALARGFENNGKPKVLVVGDSMAADLVNVLIAGNAVAELDIATISIGENCKTLFGLSEEDYNKIYGGASKVCQQEHAKALQNRSELTSADKIILGSYWWEESHLKHLPSTVTHLRSLTNAELFILGSKVQFGNGIRYLSKNAFLPNIHKLRVRPHPNTIKLNRQLRAQAQEQDYEYFDLLNLFCNKAGCQRITKDGYAIVFDETHLSENGAKFLAKNMRETEWFKRLVIAK